MKNISPLGALAIAFYVHNWNESTEIKEKQSAVKWLEKGDPGMALARIRWIADNHFYNCIFERALDKIMLQSSRALVLNRKHDFSNAEALGNRALEEVGAYFAEMFKQGHLETIPMPEFALIMPADGVVKKIEPHLHHDLPAAEFKK
jgi:hypothetical protein